MVTLNDNYFLLALKLLSLSVSFIHTKEVVLTTDIKKLVEKDLVTIQNELLKKGVSEIRYKLNKKCILNSTLI